MPTEIKIDKGLGKLYKVGVGGDLSEAICEMTEDEESLEEPQLVHDDGTISVSRAKVRQLSNRFQP
jgi:hypothetical protein